MILARFYLQSKRSLQINLENDYRSFVLLVRCSTSWAVKVFERLEVSKGAFVWDQSGIRIIGIMRVSDFFGSYSHSRIPGFPFRLFCSQEQNSQNIFRNIFLFRNIPNERTLRVPFQNAIGEHFVQTTEQITFSHITSNMNWRFNYFSLAFAQNLSLLSSQCWNCYMYLHVCRQQECRLNSLQSLQWRAWDERKTCQKGRRLENIQLMESQSSDPSPPSPPLVTKTNLTRLREPPKPYLNVLQSPLFSAQSFIFTNLRH